MVILPYRSSLNTIDNKRFSGFTHPYSTLDDAMNFRALMGILCVTVSDVC